MWSKNKQKGRSKKKSLFYVKRNYPYSENVLLVGESLKQSEDAC